MQARVSATIAFAAVIAAGRPTLAQWSSDAGPELALRTGVALPFGQLDGGSGNNLDRYASSAIPLVVEAGYRVDPTLLFGARFGYALDRKSVV